MDVRSLAAAGSNSNNFEKAEAAVHTSHSLLSPLSPLNVALISYYFITTTARSPTTFIMPRGHQATAEGISDDYVSLNPTRVPLSPRHRREHVAHPHMMSDNHPLPPPLILYTFSTLSYPPNNSPFSIFVYKNAKQEKEGTFSSRKTEKLKAPWMIPKQDIFMTIITGKIPTALGYILVRASVNATVY